MTPVEHMATLKPGDSFEFATYKRYGPKILRELTVERRTNTQLVCRVDGSEVRYRLATGLIVGDGYDRFPSPATDEEAIQLKREAKIREAAYKLGKVQWGSLPLEVLEKVDALLPAKYQKAP